MKTTYVLRRLATLMLALVICASAFPAPARAETFSAVVTAKRMIVRAGTTGKSELLGYLSEGTVVTVHSYTNGVARIEYKGKFGYALVSDMKKVATPKKSISGLGTVTAGTLTVYASASTSSKKLGTLKRGATVTVLATSDNWARLQNGSSIGYAALSGLSIREGASATPAPTKAPAATPKPAKGSGPEAVVTATKMKIYKSASTSSTVLGSLSKGAKVTVIDHKNGWALIERNGNRGYAKVSNMSLTGKYIGDTPAPALTPSPTPTPTPSPTPKYTGASGPEAVVTSDKVYVFKSANASSTLLGTLKKGAKVTVINHGNGWALIELNGKKGYTRVSGLRLTGKYIGESPTPTPSATPEPTPYTDEKATLPETMSEPAFVNVGKTAVYRYASDRSEAFSTVSAGYKLTILGAGDGWALVSNGKSKGYVPLSALMTVKDATLTPGAKTPALVSVNSLDVYEYASTFSKRYTAIAKHEKVNVLAYDANWALIERGGSTGYASVAGLLRESSMPTLPETVNLAAVINAGGAKAYEYAIETSKELASLKAGEKLIVLGYDSAWCLVERAGNRAYVLKPCVSLLDLPTLTPSVAFPGIVTISSTPVYEFATDQADEIGTLKKGAVFTALAKNDKWALIELNGKRGYVPLSAIYVQIDEFVSPTVKTLAATVITGGSKAYEYALETANVLGTIPILTDVTITAYTDKWARVSVGGKDAYILRATVSADAYTAISSGSGSGDNVLKMQKALENLGYFDGVPAGNYGSLTTSAVKRFQTQIGADASGSASTALLRVLYGGHAPASPIKSASVKLNDTGNNVLRLQTRLTYKGYLSASLDGEYGPITQSAVKLYQKTAGLTQSGTADAATMNSLFSSSAPKNTSGAITEGGTGGGGGGGNPNYSTDPGDDPSPGSGSSKTETVISTALAQLGKPYVYGTSGPNRFDCSGFTYYCYKQVGRSLNRSAQSVGYKDGTKIESASNLVRGDIVCFNTVSDNDLSDHVGIYLGNGKFIHASSGAMKVVISSLTSGYYKNVFSWGRRVL